MYIKGNIILVCVMDKRTTKKLTHTHTKKNTNRPDRTERSSAENKKKKLA